MSTLRPRPDDAEQDQDHANTHKKQKHHHEPHITYIDPGTRLLASCSASQEENIDCVRLSDLLYHDDLERIVQFNFTVDLEFLMANIHPKVRDSIPVTVIHGHRYDESRAEINRAAKQWPNVNLILPYIQDRYGTHHTKAMILFFNRNGKKSARMAVCTANLCQSDWDDMTQGIYQTPHCPLKEDSAQDQGTVIGAEYGSPFERDFINYLNAYGPSLQEIRKLVRLYDWSLCKGVLVGSVPGYHKDGNMKLWGLQRLVTVLKAHAHLDKECCKDGSTIIAQCSSVGSLRGKWFKDDFTRCMSEASNDTDAKMPDLRFMYPTVEEVSQSCTGIISSAGFLRLEDDIYTQSRSWLDTHLCRWQSTEAGRQKIMPHIKTYTRVYGKNNIAWHLLTSANLSRAAWGEFQKKNSQLYIKSYELGIFFSPSVFESSDHSNIQMLAATVRDRKPAPSEDHVSAIVPIHLPYDLPIVEYGSTDRCYTRQHSRDACVRLYGAGAADLI
ncbi:tyrosyl-DNA phosphodiesterase I [Fennellomyces sp. T-0311]|nr:tyrosyl-DNA phosphodiesterase I [Fennellomyces sp. T-0311]